MAGLTEKILRRRMQAGGMAVTKNGYSKQYVETVRTDADVTNISGCHTDQGIYPMPRDTGCEFPC